MIPFNNPPYTGSEEQFVLDAIKSHKLSGDGPYGQKCQEWFEQKLGCAKALMTPSCTHSLEMAAMLINIRPGDEVIMPSYTFVSTANAFVLRGAKVVFVDIRADTMNIDETLIEDAITDKTKAIVPVHYAGVSCEMDAIMEIAEKHDIYVIEDAAQAMMSTYKGRQLGSIGHLGAFSFHESKNYTSGGEGGLLIINDKQFMQRAEIIREKGTNRSLFFRGKVDKYTWVDIGSSYLPSELQSAYLWGQLQKVDDIYQARINSWNSYFEAFKPLQRQGLIELPDIQSSAEHNAHIFYLKVKDLQQRTALLKYLHQSGVIAVFHYVPLHRTQMGESHGRFHGTDCNTTSGSDRIIRLPMFYDLTSEALDKVVGAVQDFFTGHG